MKQISFTDGKVIAVDLSKITIRDWRGLRAAVYSNDEDDAKLAPALGMEKDELAGLDAENYRRAVMAVFYAFQNPLSDPNSQSAST